MLIAIDAAKTLARIQALPTASLWNFRRPPHLLLVLFPREPQTIIL